MNEESRDTLIDALMIRARCRLSTGPDQFNFLRQSASFGLLHIVLNAMERQAGYIAWANLGAESMRRLVLQHALPGTTADWDEGRFMFILDVALHRSAGQSVRAVVQAAFRHRRVIAYQRKGVLYVLARTGERLRLVSRTRFGADARRAAR